MADRAKIIEGLDICLKNIESPDCPSNCPYFRDCSKYENRVVFQPLMRDALALLKEQEPVEPSVDVDTYVCPNCGHRLEHQGMLGDNVVFDERYNFCPACGKAVKWK